MARSRNIKPSFFKNEMLARCEHGTRLLFIGLWGLADREGRLEDRPMRIKAELFPYESVDVDTWLDDLQREGFIHRYNIEKHEYIQIVNFKKHQNPHIKEQASTIPAPDMHHASTEVATLIPDSLNLIPDSPKKGRFTPPSLDEVADYCRQRNNNVDPQGFIAFYESKGWMIGKNKMKDWKSAVITWEKRNEANKRNGKPDTRTALERFEATLTDDMG